MKLLKLTQLFIFLTAVFAACFTVSAQTPTTLRETYKGRYNFVATGGSLRAASNSTNACSRNTSSTAALSGIPASATVFKAYLYWAGSGSATDSAVTLDTTNVTADRTYTASIVSGSNTLWYFSGVKDVTAQVAAKRNGNYTFTNLTFTTTNQTGAQYCSVQGVVGGWGLYVIYQDNALTPSRANLYEGFELILNTTRSFNLNGLYVPPAPTGRMGVLTFEGDDTIAGSEVLTFKGNSLTDAINPAGNVYNGTINPTGSTTSYGVDLDVFNVGTFLAPNDRSVTATVGSGGDLVILNSVMLAASTNVADLELSSTVSNTSPAEGSNITYTLNLFNRGVNNATGIQVRDLLPAGLTFVSASATNGTYNSSTGIWSVTSVPLNGTVSLTINATVNAGTAGTTITNPAEVVFSDNFDPDSPENNHVTTEDDYTTTSLTVKPRVDLAITKTAPSTVNIGQPITYVIEATSAGPANVTNATITDAVPASVSNVSWTCAATGTASCGTASGTGANINISANINSGAANKVTITVNGTASSAGTISNTATITAPTTVADANLANNTSTATTVAALQISGTVWRDADGSANGTFTGIQNGAETGTNAGGLFAAAISGGNVIGFSAVAANGAYSIGGIPANSSVSVLITTITPISGQPAPAQNLPAGWANTSPTVTSSFTVTNANISGRDFGIEQTPTAVGGTNAAQPNPSGSNFAAVSSAIFAASDPDGTVTKFTITAFPTNSAAVTINGATYNSSNFPASGIDVNAVSGAFPANLVSVDPIDGVVTVTFSLTATDNAGKASAVATATVPFTSSLPPNITLVKNCIAPANCESQPQLPSTDLTYRITATNDGGQSAQGLVILDRIPTNTDFKIGSTTSTMPVGVSLVVEYSYDYDALNPVAATWTSAAPANQGGGAPVGYNRLVKAIRWRFTSGSLDNAAPNNTGNVVFVVRII